MLVRVDFNVPERDGRVVDDYRIRQVIPTIKMLQKKHVKKIILLSHRSRPKMGTHLSLEFILPALRELLGDDVTFIPSIVGASDVIQSARSGSVLMLENLRYDTGEEENNPAFASRLAGLGDVFIQEAFGAMHRPHASIVALPALLPSAVGPLVLLEVETMTNLRDHPKTPFVAIIGGAKISTKLPLIETLLQKVSGLCLGGALANTVLVAKGVAVGRSIIEEEMIETVQRIELTDTKLHIPIDVIVSKATDGSQHVRACGVADVHDNEFILDIGPDTQELFKNVIQTAATTFWNGPMGLAEVIAFRGGTESIVYALAESRGFTAVGGGDTTMYLSELQLEEKISFISTGGGATLRLLAGSELPGVVAISI